MWPVDANAGYNLNMGLLAERQERRVQDQLERDYEEMRSSVMRSMRSHLRRRGLQFDELDLEGFYNTAWHALHSRLAAGEEMENPGGFLVAVACRRAIDDWRRTERRLRRDVSVDVNERGVDPDFAKLLDDRRLLREFTEGLREKLSERECQVATLCYIMDYTRPEAAEALGIPEERIQKIMDGATPKIGEFVAIIEGDGWCTEHKSMMNAYARNWLDEEGERYEFARRHLEDCPGCRLYVRAKQGLAELIPPVWLPAGAAGAHSATLATLHHAVHAAWHHHIGLIGSHVVLTHGGAAAGAGVGAGGASAGHVVAGAGAGSGTGAGGSIFASGIAAKVGISVAIVGGGLAIARLAGTGAHHSHRPPAVSASPRAAPIKTLLSADPGVPLSHASTAGVRAGPRAVRHPARLVSHKAAPRSSHAASSTSSSAEFSFETGAARSGQLPSPAPLTSTPSSAPRNGSSGAGSGSAVNSEFGFEGH
jgi:RNA polymerase sigma factor (sigma-70 family)